MSSELESFVSKPKKSKGKRSATKKQCKLCEVEFNSSRSFHDHLRGIHGVAKPYVCHVCTKCFPYASSLYNHLKIHSPDRPFICKLCGSTFRWKFCLKYHLHCAHFKSPSASRSNRLNGGAYSTAVSTKPALKSKVQAFYSKNDPIENGAKNAFTKPSKTDGKANLVTTSTMSAVGKHLANVNGIPRKARIRVYSIDGTSTNHLQLVSSPIAERSRASSASVVDSLPSANGDSTRSFGINPALDANKKIKIEVEAGSNSSGRLLERVVSRLRTLRSERISDESVASKVYFNMPKRSLDKSTQTEYACPVCSGLGCLLEQSGQTVSLK